MNHIGQRIKELRKKNDLTQEKLADLLGVTYQSVSKWECGTTMPDLTMIVPLARVLHISTDELLGMKPVEQDERKAYFDSEYFQFWKKDHEKDLEIARQAAAEYPDDYRYLYWLASNEWYVGFSDAYVGTDTEKKLISDSIRHCEMILENCDDTELRNHAIYSLVSAYSYTNQYDEAKKYAEMYPEEPESAQDDVLMLCLQGEELEFLYKKRIKKALIKLHSALSQLWYYEDEPCVEAMDAEETVIKSVITDENYQHFHSILSSIYEERARIAMRNGDPDAAVSALNYAMKHAKSFEEMQENGIEQYTCPVLSGYKEDHRDDRREEVWSLTNTVREYIEMNIFDPLRSRQDIKALFD